MSSWWVPVVGEAGGLERKVGRKRDIVAGVDVVWSGSDYCVFLGSVMRLPDAFLTL